MNCENYLKLIDDLIEGELDEPLADEVSLHIFDCPNCTAHFELLEREQEAYSHYLFDIEPPPYLQSKFEAKLRAEEKVTYQGIFAFLRFNPIWTTAVVLILFAVGFALLNLKTEKLPIEKAKEVAPIKPAQFTREQTILASVTPEKLEKPTTPKVEKIVQKRVEKVKPEIVPQPIAVKETEAVKKPTPKPKVSPQPPKINDEQLAQFKELRTFEVETEKQMEKVELLLRSFRNAQQIEESGMFDIAYEREQARRLLPGNVALRQKAEFYRNFFAEEMLNKVEPYLLDIANLDANPSPEQVLEIKDRVRNQNIIASLQAF